MKLRPLQDAINKAVATGETVVLDGEPPVDVSGGGLLEGKGCSVEFMGGRVIVTPPAPERTKA